MASSSALLVYHSKINTLDGGLHLLMLRVSASRIAPRVRASLELDSAANK
jgi:hypothetical protein